MSDRAADQLHVTIPSDPKYLPLVRAMVDEGAALTGFAQEERHAISLAVTEAMTNVIRHAYGGDQEQRIDLTLDTRDQRFRLDIIDYAEYVSPEQIASRPLDEVRPGGLGVHLIKSTMDEVHYRKNEHGGTTLTLVKAPATTKEPS
ncbi:MAG: ATP-binding protein [Planctomycetota bacterium]|nr:ATP-binding protein [Planctomycetota bacterium]